MIRSTAMLVLTREHNLHTTVDLLLDPRIETHEMKSDACLLTLILSCLRPHQSQ